MSEDWDVRNRRSIHSAVSLKQTLMSRREEREPVEGRDQIDALRRQLVEKPSAQDPSVGESVTNATERATIAEIGEIVDAARTGAAHFNSASQYRRWHRGFASKRRWKL